MCRCDLMKVVGSLHKIEMYHCLGHPFWVNLEISMGRMEQIHKLGLQKLDKHFGIGTKSRPYALFQPTIFRSFNPFRWVWLHQDIYLWWSFTKILLCHSFVNIARCFYQSISFYLFQSPLPKSSQDSLDPFLYPRFVLSTFPNEIFCCILWLMLNMLI